MKRDVGIVGAGYVGVPLAQVFAEAGKSVVLVDVNEERAAMLNRGESYIEDVPSETLKRLVTENGLSATTDYDVLREVDAILIARSSSAPRGRSVFVFSAASSSCSSRRPIQGRRGSAYSQFSSGAGSR